MFLVEKTRKHLYLPYIYIKDMLFVISVGTQAHKWGHCGGLWSQTIALYRVDFCIFCINQCCVCDIMIIKQNEEIIPFTVVKHVDTVNAAISCGFNVFPHLNQKDYICEFVPFMWCPSFIAGLTLVKFTWQTAPICSEETREEDIGRQREEWRRRVCQV